MAARYIPASKWARKPKARHFKIRDESKAKTLEKKWLAKSKAKDARRRDLQA